MEHQFGFRKGPIAEERKDGCSAAFVDVSQAFDRAWHTGLLYKLKLYCRIIFINWWNPTYPNVTLESSLTRVVLLLQKIRGPTLYLYLPRTKDVEIATFGDDTAIAAVHSEPNEATKLLDEIRN